MRLKRRRRESCNLIVGKKTVELGKVYVWKLTTWPGFFPGKGGLFSGFQRGTFCGFWRWDRRKWNGGFLEERERKRELNESGFLG